jgi:hypothetical protein
VDPETESADPSGRVIEAKAQMVGQAQARAKAQVIYGWNPIAMLVLSIILAGFVPMAVATGIISGLIATERFDDGLAAGIGSGTALATLVGAMIVLRLFTRFWARQVFIPWARAWFPSSEEVSRKRDTAK